MQFSRDVWKVSVEPKVCLTEVLSVELPHVGDRQNHTSAVWMHVLTHHQICEYANVSVVRSTLQGVVLKIPQYPGVVSRNGIRVLSLRGELLRHGPDRQHPSRH